VASTGAAPAAALASRLGDLAGLGLAFAAVTALLLALRPTTSAALTAALALLLVAPVAALLTTLLLRLVGFSPWRDELSFACAGATATTLIGATATSALGSIQQVVFAAWFGLLVLALLRSFAAPAERPEEAAAPATSASAAPAAAPGIARLRGPMGVVLAVSTGILVLGPNLHEGRRKRLVDRLTRTLGAAPELRALGLDRLGDNGAAELQARVPAGAALGFWGTHPGRLDFRRNPITDLSWPRSRATLATFLAPLSRQSLEEVDFVIVEAVKKWLGGGLDPWGSAEAGPTGAVEDVLELVAEARSARLYRVRK
jgi:hypothetical protein